MTQAGTGNHQSTQKIISDNNDGIVPYLATTIRKWDMLSRYIL